MNAATFLGRLLLLLSLLDGLTGTHHGHHHHRHHRPLHPYESDRHPHHHHRGVHRGWRRDDADSNDWERHAHRHGRKRLGQVPHHWKEEGRRGLGEGGINLFGRGFISSLQDQFKSLKAFSLTRPPPEDEKKDPVEEDSPPRRISSPEPIRGFSPHHPIIPSIPHLPPKPPTIAMPQGPSLAAPQRKTASVLGSFSLGNKGINFFSDADWIPSPPSWDKIPITPQKPSEPQLATFKRNSVPTMSLRPEFDRQYERSFDLEYKQSLFDLFLDDLGEKDYKLGDDDGPEEEGGAPDETYEVPRWRKYQSVIRDSPLCIN